VYSGCRNLATNVPTPTTDGLQPMTLRAEILSVTAILALFAPALAAQETAADGPDSGSTPRDLVVPAVIAAPFTGDLPEIRERGTLRALVSFSRTDFFVQGVRPRGIMVELLELYEKQLNKGLKSRDRRISVKYVPVTFAELIPALLVGKGDIAVGNLTVTPEREALVDFATPPRENKREAVDELVVAHKNAPELDSVDALSGQTVYVLARSSYLEHLLELNTRLEAAGKPPVDVHEADPHLATEDLLELVNAGVIQYTVADDYRALLWTEVLPDIVVREDLKVNEGGRIGWGVRKGNPELLASLGAFARTIQIGTMTGNVLAKRYYKNTKLIKNPLAESERRKLEHLVELFERYGDRYDFDWLAIVAQAYQESGLNHSAKSHVGAVGIMQLLPTTAKDSNVGIPDIWVLENNVHAGTKYMAFLRDRYFSGPEFEEEDRFAFTWAAYNAGPGRVRTMRRKAKKMGLDPNRWFGHVEHAARAVVGRETVQYVGNIFKYYITYKTIGEVKKTRERTRKALSEGGG